MKSGLTSSILSVVACFLFALNAGETYAQLIFATGDDADITDDGLHRLDPLIMKAAWVRPDIDLSPYTRALLMPTAVTFRDVPDTDFFANRKTSVQQFPVPEDRQEWLGELWREAIEAEFTREESYDVHDSVGLNVLVIQAYLVDVVSHIPPDAPGSDVTYITDPWEASLVLEIRDATTTQVLARSIDRRYGEGQLTVGEVWIRTETLIQRWAEVLFESVEEISVIGGRDTTTPSWAR
ncbi:MAG: hypothetical protein ACJ0SL_06910 [Candidatus Rariloculaceae bacterium]